MEKPKPKSKPKDKKASSKDRILEEIREQNKEIVRSDLGDRSVWKQGD